MTDNAKGRPPTPAARRTVRVAGAVMASVWPSWSSRAASSAHSTLSGSSRSCERTKFQRPGSTPLCCASMRAAPLTTQ